MISSFFKALLFPIAFTMEQDIPDYDMDSDDEKWINSQAEKFEITPLHVHQYN